jgi:hypothetical protein
MGRGRAKAKQTKVARELKYRSIGTDLTSLAAELRTEGHEVPPAYADLAEEYGGQDEDDSAPEQDGSATYEDLRKSG